MSRVQQCQLHYIITILITNDTVYKYYPHLSCHLWWYLQMHVQYVCVCYGERTALLTPLQGGVVLLHYTKACPSLPFMRFWLARAFTPILYYRIYYRHWLTLAPHLRTICTLWVVQFVKWNRWGKKKRIIFWLNVIKGYNYSMYLLSAIFLLCLCGWGVQLTDEKIQQKCDRWRVIFQCLTNKKHT